MTRGQVARLLGKNVTTVRRLQAGGHIRFRKDPFGVYHFEETEVLRLKEKLERREVSGVSAGAPWKAPSRRLEDENRSLKVQLAELSAEFERAQAIWHRMDRGERR